MRELHPADAPSEPVNRTFAKPDSPGTAGHPPSTTRPTQPPRGASSLRQSSAPALAQPSSSSARCRASPAPAALNTENDSCNAFPVRQNADIVAVTEVSVDEGEVGHPLGRITIALGRVRRGRTSPAVPRGYPGSLAFGRIRSGWNGFVHVIGVVGLVQDQLNIIDSRYTSCSRQSSRRPRGGAPR
jgi:hypothetical protein